MSKKPRMPRKRPMVVAFPAEEPMQGFSSIAHNHWRTARCLLDEIEASPPSSFPCHWKGASTLCVFHAAFECFLNEELAFVTALGWRDVDAMRLLQDQYVSDKIDPFLRHYGIESLFSAAIRDDVKLMCKLRNLAYHHSPEMGPDNEFPEALMDVINRIGLTPINTAWTSYLSHVPVLRWARDAVGNFIGEFDRCRGRPPTLKRFGWAMPYEITEDGSASV